MKVKRKEQKILLIYTIFSQVSIHYDTCPIFFYFYIALSCIEKLKPLLGLQASLPLSFVSNPCLFFFIYLFIVSINSTLILIKVLTFRETIISFGPASLPIACRRRHGDYCLFRNETSALVSHRLQGKPQAALARCYNWFVLQDFYYGEHLRGCASRAQFFLGIGRGWHCLYVGW